MHSPGIKRAIEGCINPSVCHSLKTRGYAIVDRVFGTEWAQGFRREIQLLHQNRIMFSNATHVHLPNAQHPLFIDKSRIMEMELIPEIYSIVPDYLRALDEDDTIMNQLNKCMHDHVQLSHQAIKLQHNSGGCFPLHFDSDPKLDPRKVSAVLYLNPDWKLGDGGELKLYPFPFEPVTIEPIMDRLVLFASTNTLHRVLPFNRENDPNKERICLTLWYSGNYQPGHSATGSLNLSKPRDNSVKSVIEFLMQPKYRKHLVKLVYADEWATSICESHEPSEGRDILLRNHWQDVEKIRNAFKSYIPVIQEHLPISFNDSPMLDLDWI